jgi:hypothetical protein
MTALFTGLIGAHVAAALVTVAERRQGPAQKNAEGWKVLRPGWLVIFFLVISAGLAALMSYIVLFVGSSLPDAKTQMAAGLIIVVVCWFACIHYGWTSYGRTVMWKGNELRVRTIFGRERMRRIPDVSRVSKSEALGEYKLTFKDGSALRLSAYSHGAKELVKRLPKRARD